MFHLKAKALGLSLVCAFSYSTAVSAFEFPRGTQTQVVAEGIIQNGVEMDIVDVSSNKSPEDFLQELLPKLSSQHGEPVVSAVANNAVSVGIINDKTYQSIVLQDGPLGSTKGIYSVVYLNKNHKFIPPEFQLPTGNKLVSYTQDKSAFGGRFTWVYSYDKSPTYLVNSLDQLAQSGGWSSDTGSGFQQPQSGVRYFSYSKRGSSSEIVIQQTPEGAAVVVMEQQ